MRDGKGRFVKMSQSKQPMDYFDAKQAVHRLEAAISKHLFRPDDPLAYTPMGEQVVDLGVPKEQESLADFVLRRRSELEKQQKELAFLQDVAELMRNHPQYFSHDGH